MGWEIGYDSNWDRDIGYGVPCYCDHPGCNEVIDRGLSYVCGGEPYGGDRGCGLFFCFEHLLMHSRLPQLCHKCSKRQKPFNPKMDHPDWVNHKLTDESWEEWRNKNPEKVNDLKKLKVLTDKTCNRSSGENFMKEYICTFVSLLIFTLFISGCATGNLNDPFPKEAFENGISSGEKVSILVCKQGVMPMENVYRPYWPDAPLTSNNDKRSIPIDLIVPVIGQAIESATEVNTDYNKTQQTTYRYRTDIAILNADKLDKKTWRDILSYGTRPNVDADRPAYRMNASQEDYESDVETEQISVKIDEYNDRLEKLNLETNVDSGEKSVQ